MIVLYSEEGWKVITQRAHGVLSFQVAMRWKHDQLPTRWTELLLAIAEHDDAEVELDGENLLTTNGGPLNYEMKTFDLDNCTRLAELSVTKSRYVALLTSMHMNFLYADDARSDPGAKKFLAEEAKKRNKLRKELGMSEKEVDHDYAILEWCDAFSLLLCRDDLQPEQRKIEISKGPENVKYQLHQDASDNLVIDPWPFDKKEFRVAVEYRLIKELKFDSSAAFRKAFYEADIKEDNWLLASK